jgi:hypothetical protein
MSLVVRVHIDSQHTSLSSSILQCAMIPSIFYRIIHIHIWAHNQIRGNIPKTNSKENPNVTQTGKPTQPPSQGTNKGTRALSRTRMALEGSTSQNEPLLAWQPRYTPWAFLCLNPKLICAAVRTDYTDRWYSRHRLKSLR